MESQIARLHTDGPINVAAAERLVSLVVGGLLALDGLRRKSPTGAIEAFLGSALLERGATGHGLRHEVFG